MNKPKYNLGDKVYYLNDYGTKIYTLTINRIQHNNTHSTYSYGFKELGITLEEKELYFDYKKLIDDRITELLLLFKKTYNKLEK